MTGDGVLVVAFLFRSVWRMFTSFVIPGTHATPAEWGLFSLLVVLAIRTIRVVLIPGRSGGDDK